MNQERRHQAHARETLSSSAASSALDRLREKLSVADHDRLLQVINRLDPISRQASLGGCLDAIFADQDVQARLSAFRSLRNRVAKKAAATGVDFELAADLKKRTPPSERRCWFVGADLAESRARAATKASAGNDPTIGGVSNQAIPLERRVLVWWHESDDVLARRVFEGLRVQIDAAAAPVRLTSRWDVEIGRCAADRMQELVREASVVVALLSPAFLGRSEELVLLERSERQGRLLPADLHPISEDHNLGCFEGLQRFHLRVGAKSRAYGELRDAKSRERFVAELASKLQAAVRSQATGLTRTPGRSASIEKLIRRDLSDDDASTFVRSTASRFTLEDTSLHATRALPTPGAKDAVELLLDWIRSGETRHCAVLGEYGVGKTTTLKALTRSLEDLRGTEPGLPLPIFLDLRFYSESLRKGAAPDLKTIIQEAVNAAWFASESDPPTPDDILELVREHGALLIFDGLDEKLVHMTEAQGRAFIREIMKALPPWDRREKSLGSAGRLIVSCRSSYFRTLREQRMAFRGIDRDDARPEDFSAFIILPFNEPQIKQYLQNIHISDPNGAIELFRSVHNLTDLASRPYLLRLIAEQLGDLEARRARGEPIFGVTLYRGFVDRWLERDTGKHRIPKEDKPRLMQDLAADMWRSGAREWPWSDVREWLRRRLADSPPFALAAIGQGGGVELLEEDLRTATFILRPDLSEESFRFAHTSMQEYFLAERLLRATLEGDSESLATPHPSGETLDFLGQLIQLLAARERAAALSTLSRAIERPGLAAILALRYWVMAGGAGWPGLSPGQIDLSGLDLSEMLIGGASPERPLNLCGAVMSGADFSRAVFRNVLLHRADFSGVRAVCAEFDGVEAHAARFDAASDFSGVDWRGGSITASCSFGDANWHGARIVEAQLQGVEMPEAAHRRPFVAGEHPMVDTASVVASIALGAIDEQASCAWSPDGSRIVSGSSEGPLFVWDAATGRRLLAMKGHQGSVWSCVWSPDGSRIASGSDDNTLIVWDAATGRRLLTIEGQQGSIMSCAWSPDGSRIVSGSNDTTLIVWDAATGSRLLELKGHQGWVWSCAWSPDGSRIVSGSNDTKLIVWDAATGRRLLAMRGHQGSVWCCAWSPDGSRIVSGSNDHTLSMWDAVTGRRLLAMEVQQGSIMSCAWSPDGSRIVSGSRDNTLVVWDAVTGRRLRVMEGHRGWVMSCAWSPDGSQIVSGSNDRTLITWDAVTGRRLLAMEVQQGSIMSCVWSPDGSRIVSGSNDHRLIVWDAETGRRLRVMEGHRGWVMSCAWSPDGSRIVTGSNDDTMIVWDAVTGRPLMTIQGHQDSIMSCAWSPDGSRIVSGSNDTTLIVWDAATASQLLELKGHQGRVWSCAWSPDGSRIVSGATDNTLIVWDAATGQRVLKMEVEQGSAMSCAWSPDGSRIVSGSRDNTLIMWDAKTGRRLRTMKGHQSWVWSCAWSPDGSRIVSGSDDHTLIVWDAATGQRVLKMEVEQGSAMSCAWSPDGSRIVSGSNDNTLIVREAATGSRLLMLASGGNDGWVAVREGRFIAVGGDAWRFSGWNYFDEEAGYVRVLPLEHFGPIEALGDGSIPHPSVPRSRKGAKPVSVERDRAASKSAHHN